MRPYCIVRIVELDLTVDEYTFPTKRKYLDFIYAMNTRDYCTARPQRRVEHGIAVLVFQARLY